MATASLSRKPVHRRSSAKSFRKRAGKSAAANLRAQPMRGGWRM